MALKPAAIMRLSHFVETATSNFLFGVLIAGVI